MGWFGRKREPRDANEMLRAYNEAEAARLSGLTTGGPSGSGAPAVISATSGSGELVVEDVFTITGRGLVATGRVSAGVLRVGDPVSILRTRQPTAASEITGIEMFRKKTDEAPVGTAAGLLLKPSVDLARGDVIRVTPTA